MTGTRWRKVLVASISAGWVLPISSAWSMLVHSNCALMAVNRGASIPDVCAEVELNMGIGCLWLGVVLACWIWSFRADLTRWRRSLIVLLSTGWLLPMAFAPRALVRRSCDDASEVGGFTPQCMEISSYMDGGMVWIWIATVIFYWAWVIGGRNKDPLMAVRQLA